MVTRADSSWDEAIKHLKASHAGDTLATINADGEQDFLESLLDGGNAEGNTYSGEYWPGAYQVVDPSIKKDDPNYARIG
ncbi:MAG: hypothetical protein QNJ04_01680 [Desulfobacterales bacterium]|nr:hypothetical protein [Desulfobacterales bacterium]